MGGGSESPDKTCVSERLTSEILCKGNTPSNFRSARHSFELADFAKSSARVSSFASRMMKRTLAGEGGGYGCWGGGGGSHSPEQGSTSTGRSTILHRLTD